MMVRQGGTYEADPLTGEERRISGTDQPDQAGEAPSAAPDVSAAPDAPPTPPAPSRLPKSRVAADSAAAASQE